MTEVSQSDKKTVFTCPQCGKHRLEEVMKDVTLFSLITSVGEGGDFFYGDHYDEGGEVDRFQCADCGWTIPDVHTAEGLYEYLVSQEYPLSNESYVKQKYPDAHIHEAPDEFEVWANIHDGEIFTYDILGVGNTQEEAWDGARDYVDRKPPQGLKEEED